MLGRCAFLWLDRQSGTLSRMITGHLIALLTVLNICVRHTCFHGTRSSSTLGVGFSCDDVLYKFTFTLYYIIIVVLCEA